jgi:hypothetical protein
MERLLAFRSLPHDPQCVLATVQPLALVLGKLLSEALLCLGCALEGIDRHFEIPSAVGAHTNGRNGSKPFDYAEISLFHTPQCPTGPRSLAIPYGNQTAPLPFFGSCAVWLSKQAAGCETL